MKRCLVIFAKEPIPGKVKTRLSDGLTPRECAAAYKAFLKDTIAISKKITVDSVFIAYDFHGEPEFLKKLAPGYCFIKQKGRDLGTRLVNVFDNISKTFPGEIIFIGSDAPNLPTRLIEKAFTELDDNDIVLGPTYDGGYYLIGLKNSCPDLFKDIEWSTNRVFSQTISKAKRLNKKVFTLPKWYDVDNGIGLKKLKNDISKDRDKETAKWTRKFLKI